MAKLTTFGETMLRFSPPPGERLETATQLEIRTGGAESNVAIVAANLGTETAWVSKLPQTPLGRRVVRDLHTNGVETSVVWDDRTSSRQGTYYLEIGSQPRGTNVLYDRVGSAFTSTSPEELNQQLVRDAEYFCTSGITPALSETVRETTDELLETATQAGTRTVFDLNYRSNLWSTTEASEAMERLLPKADVICTAERDARTVLGATGDIDAVATELQAAYNAELVIVTRGADGAIAAHEGTIHRQAAFPAETIDPVGSGDAFVGGFLAHRLEGETVPEALEAAAATAALSRTMKGDWAVVSSDEVANVRAGESGISR